ncbi:hypothetical protein [Legionella yabuuchiae]|uniref:hypothetical protein n=1 Tax=Legionella yabuuchiae TaxID=376727 RepID=UPI00105418D0|nr:hypothetical protein [Legionella yabuuchiae]
MDSDKQSNVDYTTKPSAFLEKAYTIQAYDNNGKLIENRHQTYIDAGTEFWKYCDNPPQKSTLNEDKVLLNDAGRLVGAINSALSQINHIEQKLKENNHDSAAALLPALKGSAQTVLDSAKQSKIIDVIPNQNVFQKALSGLKDFVDGIKQLFANIGKNEEEINKEKFKEIKEKYQQVIATPVEGKKNEDKEHKEEPTTGPTNQ